jgi:hypothetical protein
VPIERLPQGEPGALFADLADRRRTEHRRVAGQSGQRHIGALKLTFGN